MNHLTLTLEEIMFLLIKCKCSYFFGFRDCFLKYDKVELFTRFEKIADDLEGKDYITRGFNNTVELKGDIKNYFENIINVDRYFDINIAKYGELKKKIRVFEGKNDSTLIEAQVNDNGKLDENNLDLYLCSAEDVIKKIKKSIENGYKNKCSEPMKMEISNKYIESIKGISIADFEKLNKEKNIESNHIINNLYNTINNTKELLSISITDMNKRKSKVYMYLTNRDNMIALNFKLKGETHNWVLTEMDDESLNNDLSYIINNKE